MNFDNSLSVLACQIHVPCTKNAQIKNRHLENTSRLVADQLDEQHSDLVLLPELSSIDYSRDSFERLSELSEVMEGESFQVWREVAKKHRTTVLYSFPRVESGRYYISIAAVGPNGELIGFYDKMHLAQFGESMEKEYFSRGKRMFTLSVKGFVLAPIICYDIRIPEMSRALALAHNVDVILHAGAYYRDESFYSWHHFAITRAIENQVYFLSLNRAGDNYGNSIFCGPWVDETAPPMLFSEKQEDFHRLIIDRGAISRARERYSFLKDRFSHYPANENS